MTDLNQTDKPELDALGKIALEAAGIEAGEAAAQEAALNPNPEPEIDQGAIWAQIPQMLGGLLSIAMPELKAAYTESACLAWGGAMAQVAQKYEWDATETMAKWAPEISLLFTSIPLVLPTVAAIKARRKEEKPVQQATEKSTVVDLNNPMAEAPGNFTVPT